MPPYKVICSALEDQSGWRAEPCEGMNMQGSPMGDMVTANRSYTKGNKKIDVMVIGGMNAMGYWAPFQANMQVDSSEQFVKLTQIKGFNVGISYEKKQKSGGVVIAFESKDAPGTTRAVMVFNFTNMGWRDALCFAKKFDWEKIRRLFH